MSPGIFALLSASAAAAFLAIGFAIGGGRRRYASRERERHLHLIQMLDAELHTTDERLRLATSMAEDTVWDWTVGSDTIVWGDAIRKLHGGDPQPAFTWWTSHIHPDDRGQTLDLLNHALAAEDATSVSAEYRFARAEGGWVWVFSRGHIIRDDDGNAVRMIGSMTDITEQRKTQQQLRQAERLASLGRLAAGMAHEFNNVLMAIQPFADVLRRRRDDATVDRAVDQISRAVQRGRRVTDEIMRFTRPPKPAFRKMDLASWLAGQRNELQALIAPVAVVVDVPPQGLGVECDAGQLQQALVTLVINARDAMSSQGLVTIKAAEASREEAARHGVTGSAQWWIHLTIHDDGSGITDQDLPHVFEPLFTTKRSGTGLGLAITHAAIRAHGGVIDAESRLGEGTTFHIFLPRVEIESVPAHLPSGDRRQLPRRVLMIEDDHAVAAGLSALLATEGCEVAVATTGADGLREIERFRPGVVILDIDLPDANGRELYTRIRAVVPDLPIVLTSGHVLGVTEDDANVVFLQKPYEIDALIAAVSAAGA
jgi:PAS domain S-box-containing protein